ncbi:MAG: hypothetical protein JWR50_368 [Mucilaginibacter sp.]|nr:hypothetical protein [Mucilaginibacter sp.]
MVIKGSHLRGLGFSNLLSYKGVDPMGQEMKNKRYILTVTAKGEVFQKFSFRQKQRVCGRAKRIPGE